MKLSVIVTDDAGNSWQHEFQMEARSVRLLSESQEKRSRGRSDSDKDDHRRSKDAKLDLSLPIRPFMKRHASGMPGAKKFTLLLAHLAGGDVEAEIERSRIEKQWNKMTGLMGGPFNAAHTSRAKDNGWADSPRHGTYKLLPGWRSVLTNG